MSSLRPGDIYLSSLKEKGTNVGLILDPPSVRVPILDCELKPITRMYTYYSFTNFSGGILFQDLLQDIFTKKKKTIDIFGKYSNLCLYVQLLTALYIRGEEEKLDSFTWETFLKLDGEVHFYGQPSLHRMIADCLNGSAANNIHTSSNGRPVVSASSDKKKVRLSTFWRRSPF